MWKRLRSLGLAMFLLAGSMGSAFGQTGSIEGTDVFVQQWVKGYGNRDTGMLSRLIQPSTANLFVLATGERLESRDDYLDAQGAVFRGMDGLKLTLKSSQFKSVDGRTAWGVVYMDEAVDYGEETLHFGLLQTFTLLRTPEGWRLVMLHESVTQASE